MQTQENRQRSPLKKKQKYKNKNASRSSYSAGQRAQKKTCIHSDTIFYSVLRVGFQCSVKTGYYVANKLYGSWQ